MTVSSLSVPLRISPNTRDTSPTPSTRRLLTYPRVLTHRCPATASCEFQSAHVVQATIAGCCSHDISQHTHATPHGSHSNACLQYHILCRLMQSRHRQMRDVWRPVCSFRVMRRAALSLGTANNHMSHCAAAPNHRVTCVMYCRSSAFAER